MPPRRRHPLDRQVLGTLHRPAPPDPRYAPACACGHGMALHGYGRRNGINVRTYCSTAGCHCQLYVATTGADDDE